MTNCFGAGVAGCALGGPTGGGLTVSTPEPVTSMQSRLVFRAGGMSLSLAVGAANALSASLKAAASRYVLFVHLLQSLIFRGFHPAILLAVEVWEV